MATRIDGRGYQLWFGTTPGSTFSVKSGLLAPRGIAEKVQAAGSGAEPQLPSPVDQRFQLGARRRFR